MVHWLRSSIFPCLFGCCPNMVTSNQISTNFHIYRHKSPLLTQYHLIPSSAKLHWPSITKYQPVPPHTDTVTLYTNQYQLLLTQYHQVPSSTRPSTIIWRSLRSTFNVFSNRLFEQMKSRISCLWAIFWNFSFHTSPEIAYLKICQVTIVACVWFSHKWLFTCPLKSPAWTYAKSQLLQMCKISPLWFSDAFSTCLLEQMQSHIICMFVIFSRVSIQMCSQIACLSKCKITIVVDVRDFPIIISKRLLKSPAKSH